MFSGSENSPMPTDQQRAAALQSAVTIRPARDADAADLHRLAVLDSAEIPPGPLLLAEVDGVLRAALAIGDGTVIADPFAPTADVVALLLERAKAARARQHRPGRNGLRRRVATRLA